MEVEELCSCITNFFGQTYNYDPFSEKKILEYEDCIFDDADNCIYEDEDTSLEE